jgi:acyl-CoA dehydrogenase
MTQADVAGSDPTQIQTSAVLEGDEWVINGRKWFTSGAHGADFAIVIARTDPDAQIEQARSSAFIVPLTSPGFKIACDVQMMGGGGGHPDVSYTDVRVPNANMLGERGGGHKLGQVRLGPARLAHCMRWLGQIEQALEMLVDRAMQVHGALGYSNDTPLARMLIGARWARIADGSDEVHLMRSAEMVRRWYNETGSVNHAVGDLPV